MVTICHYCSYCFFLRISHAPRPVKDKAKPRFHASEASPVCGRLDAPRTALSAKGVGSSSIVTILRRLAPSTCGASGVTGSAGVPGSSGVGVVSGAPGVGVGVGLLSGVVDGVVVGVAVGVEVGVAVGDTVGVTVRVYVGVG